MSRLARCLFLSKGHISKEDAREIARRVCQARPPVVGAGDGAPRLWDWEVWTYADHRGGNVRVDIDRGAGAVKAVFGPMLR
jgi:hypothetical protein